MKLDFALLFYIFAVFFSFISLASGDLMPLAIGLIMSVMGMLIERKQNDVA